MTYVGNSMRGLYLMYKAMNYVTKTKVDKTTPKIARRWKK